jgi:hypothetical protein
MDSHYNPSLTEPGALILDVINGEYLTADYLCMGLSFETRPWFIGSKEIAAKYILTLKHSEEYELVEMSEIDYLWRFSFGR